MESNNYLWKCEGNGVSVNETVPKLVLSAVELDVLRFEIDEMI